MKSFNNFHVCLPCDKIFATAAKLSNHLRTHTGEKPFKCGTCAKEFCSKSGLNYHQVTQHSNLRIYKCEHPGCNKTFKRIDVLNRHKWTHKKHGRFECIFCQHTNRDREQLFLHLNVHTREKPYFCEVCGCEKACLNQVKDHYMSIHTGERPYKCDSCTKAFQHRASLSSHHKRIHDKVPHPKLPSRCVDCGERFANNRALARHRIVHTGIPKPHKCSMCDKRFWIYGDLTSHLRTHTREKPYKCDICLKAFISASNLGSHRETHETTRKKHHCPKCNKTFCRSRNVQKHITTVHEGQQPYECIFCQAKRSDEMHFFIHLRSHISEKPFICDVCLHESSSEETATSHYFRCHAKQLPYGCGLCKKRYISARSLRDHQVLKHKQQTKKCKSSFSIRDHLFVNEFISHEQYF